jgi:hypothetical protein
VGNAALSSSVQSAPARLFHIGKDIQGHWVVQDESGLCGGLFTDRAQAMRFALFENGNRSSAIVMVAGICKLEFTRH